MFCFYGGGCGEARSGETSKWSSLNSCVGLLSGNSPSWGGVFSGDSARSACGFLLSCGSFRNLRRGREQAITINVCVAVGKRQEENDKAKKGTQTWRGVFVLAPFWWCWACSSAAKHGTFSHRSYCLGSVKKSSHLLCPHVPRFCCFVSPPACSFSTQSWVLTLWFPQRRASPLGSTTLNTRLPWSSHLM